MSSDGKITRIHNYFGQPSKITEPCSDKDLDALVVI